MRWYNRVLTRRCSASSRLCCSPSSVGFHQREGNWRREENYKNISHWIFFSSSATHDQGPVWNTQRCVCVCVRDIRRWRGGYVCFPHVCNSKELILLCTSLWRHVLFNIRLHLRSRFSSYFKFFPIVFLLLWLKWMHKFVYTLYLFLFFNEYISKISVSIICILFY